MLKRKKQSTSCRLLVFKKPAFLALERGLVKSRRKLHLFTEYPCFTEDSQVKLYLLCQRVKPEEEADKKLLRFVAKLTCAVLITYLFGLWATSWAFQQRGYVAYGGEYLLIFVFFCIVVKLLKLGKEV